MILRAGLISNTFSHLQIKSLLCAGTGTYQCKCVSNKVMSQSFDWEPIFKLPAIKWIAAFNRLKIYQLGLTGFMVPASFALESTGLVAPEVGLISLALGVSGCLTLGLCSHFTKNFIGFIYINEKGDKIKLAYVDYWGRRKHVDVPVKSVVPLMELPSNKLDKFNFYQNVIVADGKTSYKLAQKHGEVTDPELFSSVFGE